MIYVMVCLIRLLNVIIFFKDWAKNIELQDKMGFDTDSFQNGQPLNKNMLVGISGIASNGHTFTINQIAVEHLPNRNYYAFQVIGARNNADRYIIKWSTIVPQNGYYMNSISGGGQIFDFNGNYIGSDDSPINFSRRDYVMADISAFPIYINDNTDNNINGFLYSDVNETIFKTNTDYLERLQGQEKDRIDVIDVTDIKHPIFETLPNTKAELSYNRGFNRKSPDDDNDEVVGGLVPTEIFYRQLDDYNEGMQNAITEYDNNIQENPENQDKVFVSPSPIVDINNFFNTLPVVSTPVANTVVNNNYTYNNYYNNNTTIYEVPYNTDLIPNLPTLFFENKFPFCIPWDIYSFISLFYVEKEAPRIDIPFPIMGANGLDVETVTIDLSGYDYLSTIMRVMFFVLFLVGLMLLTRQLIKG